MPIDRAKTIVTEEQVSNRIRYLINDPWQNYPNMIEDIMYKEHIEMLVSDLNRKCLDAITEYVERRIAGLQKECDHPQVGFVVGVGASDERAAECIDCGKRATVRFEKVEEDK